MMKKTYETPSVDKIAFNYRDQVVATSGNAGSVPPGRTIFSDACNVQTVIVIGYDVCSMLPFNA